MPMRPPKKPRPASRASRRLSIFALRQSRPSPCSRTRMAALEGAPVARATASGMAAVTADFLAALQDRRSCGRGQGDVRRLPLCDRGRAAALRHRRTRWSTATDTRAMASGDEAGDEDAVPGDAGQSRRSPIVDMQAVAEIADSSRRAADRRQRLRHARAAAADGIRRRISWCIPRPNISTARAARWAG